MQNQTSSFIWFWGTTAVLAVALFFPVSRMIWVWRVRRAEKKLERSITDEEREELRGKTRLIAAIIVICFAYFFNRTLLSP